MAIIVLAAVVGSCSRPATEPDPQAALAGYLDALISGNSEEAARYLIKGIPPKWADVKPAES